MKLNMCVVETKMKAESENGCGPTSDSCSNDYWIVKHLNLNMLMVIESGVIPSQDL